MSKIKVAIIDDDESANRALGRVVRSAGFDTRGYGSAEAYLADPLRGQYHCLLVDIQLTGISGIELLRHLQAVGNLTPVIFISAYEDPAVRLEAERRGCAGFFRKTESGEVILETLQRATAPPVSGNFR